MREYPTYRKVRLFPVTTPRLYGEPSQHIIVLVEASDGTRGWGEISDVSHLPAMQPDVKDLEQCLQALLEGRSIMETGLIEELLGANFPGTRFYGKACLVRAGVSIAVHDLKARFLGTSLSTLLGGARRTRIPVCYPIFRMKSRGDVADRLGLVREQVEAGFRSFRLYLSKETDADVELLERVLGEFGSKITISALDGSGLFTLPAFLRSYRRLAAFPFDYVESPVSRDDVELIAEARASIDHPVSEHVRSLEYALQLIRCRAVDIFNISITVAGGIGPMLGLFTLAQAASLECVIGTTQELSIATAAQAHVGAVVPRLDYPSDPVGPKLYCIDVVKGRVRIENGEIVVPTGPGLGVEVDPALIESVSAPLSSLNNLKTGFPRG